MIIVEGRAQKPTYVAIKWGMENGEVLEPDSGNTTP
jgi:aldehyde:ferredoxin oxidoreductase